MFKYFVSECYNIFYYNKNSYHNLMTINVLKLTDFATAIRQVNHIRFHRIFHKTELNTGNIFMGDKPSADERNSFRMRNLIPGEFLLCPFILSARNSQRFNLKFRAKHFN